MSEEEAVEPEAAEAESTSTPADDAEASLDARILAAIDERDTDHDDGGDMHVSASAGADDEDDAEGDEDEDDEEHESLPGDDDDLEDEADEGAQGSSEDDQDEEPDEDDALFDAMMALRAQGVPASVIKSTPKAKLLAWGAAVAAKGKAPGGAGSDSAETDDDGIGTAKTAGGDDPAQGAHADLSRFTKPFAEELGVEEEAASKALKPILDHMASLEKRLEGSEGASLAARGQAQIDMQLRRLEGKYPGLTKDATRLEAVMDEARTLAAGMKASGKEIDARALFDKAALLVNGRPKRSDMKQLRRNGSSTPPTTRPDRLTDGPVDETDYFARVLDEVDAGRLSRAKRIKPPRIKTRLR